MIVHVAEAAAALQAHDDILILTHRRPDGDTAGCAGALCRGLRQIGKRAYILENPEITRRYAPMITGCYPPDDFNPAVYRFDRYRRGKAVPRYGGAV